MDSMVARKKKKRKKRLLDRQTIGAADIKVGMHTQLICRDNMGYPLPHHTMFQPRELNPQTFIYLKSLSSMEHYKYIYTSLSHLAIVLGPRKAINSTSAG